MRSIFIIIRISLHHYIYSSIMFEYSNSCVSMDCDDLLIPVKFLDHMYVYVNFRHRWNPAFGNLMFKILQFVFIHILLSFYLDDRRQSSTWSFVWRRQCNSSTSPSSDAQRTVNIVVTISIYHVTTDIVPPIRLFCYSH